MTQKSQLHLRDLDSQIKAMKSAQRLSTALQSVRLTSKDFNISENGQIRSERKTKWADQWTWLNNGLIQIFPKAFYMDGLRIPSNWRSEESIKNPFPDWFSDLPSHASWTPPPCNQQISRRTTVMEPPTRMDLFLHLFQLKNYRNSECVITLPLYETGL